MRFCATVVLASIALLTAKAGAYEVEYWPDNQPRKLKPVNAAPQQPVKSYTLETVPLVQNEPANLRLGDDTYAFQAEGLYRVKDPRSSKVLRQSILYRGDAWRLAGHLSRLYVYGARHQSEQQTQWDARARNGEPLSLQCGFISMFVQHHLREQGIASRLVGCTAGSNWKSYDDGHALMEICDPAEKRWIAFDPTLGARFRDGGGRLLDLLDLTRLHRAGRHAEHVEFLNDGSKLDPLTYYEELYAKYIPTRQQVQAFLPKFKPLLTNDVATIHQWYGRVMQVPIIDNYFVPETDAEDALLRTLPTWKNLVRLTAAEFRQRLYDRAGCANSSAAVADKSDIPQAIDIADRRELFVDRHLIESLDGGAALKLHTPVPAGKALVFDRPWEGVHCAYVTVIKDEGVYRMYYRGMPIGAKDGTNAETTCYAESKDGVTWTKPDLGLFEVKGTRQNNVILADAAPYSHNFSPFIDNKPGVPSTERYKAVAGIAPGSLQFFASPDGVRWTKMEGKSFFEKGWVFDSQNVAFWSEAEGKYVLFYRRVVKNVRQIARATSDDLVNWTPGALMSGAADPPVPQEQFYTNQTHPYFRAPQVYVSLAARFMEGRATLSEQQRAVLKLDAANWLTHDCSDAVFMTCRPGAERYDRTFAGAIIRPGLDPQNWVSRANYPALGVVPTGAGEMSLYVQRGYGQPTHHLERLTLRTDGFASVNSPGPPGEMRTRVLRFKGKSLELNYSTSAAGSVRVEIQDADGEPIPGFTAADAQPLTGDALDQVVAWKGAEEGQLASLAGKPVRLRFVLADADLYSLRFRE